LHANQTVEVCLSAADRRREFLRDVRTGLRRRPKELSPKYLYDDRGARLFDEITTLPEYYPTECERSLLRDCAREVTQRTEARCLVELGGGSAEKTHVLLDALHDAGTLEKFVALEINQDWLVESGRTICAESPGVKVHGIVGDFHQHLDRIPDGGRRLFAFLGSTIGNLYPEQRQRFYQNLNAQAHPGDFLLLGTDLVKDVDRLLEAYDDPKGVTRAFIKNLLRVLNREAQGDFDPDRFSYSVTWNAPQTRLEIELESEVPQKVHLRTLDLDVEFAQGEALRAEISAKFTRTQVEAELGAAGFKLANWWSDDADDYALSLWRVGPRLVAR